MPGKWSCNLFFTAGSPKISWCVGVYKKQAVSGIQSKVYELIPRTNCSYATHRGKNAGVCIKSLFLEAQAPVTFPSETKESEEIRYKENVQIFAGRLKERPIN